MNARNELAETVRLEVYEAVVSISDGYHPRSEDDHAIIHKAAETIMSAIAPRTVDSADELKAESDGTILRDEHGMVGVIASDPDGSGFRYVLAVDDPRPYTFAAWMVSPSLVLFTPGGEG